MPVRYASWAISPGGACFRVAARVAAGGGDASGVETVADDRGEGERVLRRFGKLGESFGDGVGDLTRTAGLERGDGARFAPLLLVPAELMDDVLDEEWVATGDAV